MHGNFTILGIDFPAYFTLLMVGFAAGIYTGWKYAERAGVDPNRILDLGILLVVCGIVGSRIAHVLFDGQLSNYYYLCVDPLQTTGEFLPGPRAIPCQGDAQCAQAKVGEICNGFAGTCHWGRDCLRAFKFWYGGLTYYGGFLLVVPCGIWFLRRHKINVWRVGDLAGFCIPLGVGFGRLGCHLAGCCFGDVCDLPWAVQFPAGSPAAREHLELHLIGPADESLPVHPTQLYSIAFNWAIAGLMVFWYHRRKTFDGEVFWLFTLLYSGARFMVEMFRADERGELLGVSTSQWIGLGLILLSLFMLARLHRRAGAAGTQEPGPGGEAPVDDETREETGFGEQAKPADEAEPGQKGEPAAG